MLYNVKTMEHENYILLQSNGNLTMVGGDAWRLYYALATDFRWIKSEEAGFSSMARNMRHLLEYATPCDDVRPQLELALRVEAALLNAELDWPHFTCGPVALRLASDLPED